MLHFQNNCAESKSRPRQKDPEPELGLTDGVGPCHGEASIVASIPHEPRLAHATVQSQGHGITSRQQIPNIGRDEEQEQAHSGAPSQYMHHRYCNSATQTSCSSQTKASPGSTDAAGAHIQYLISKTEAHDRTTSETEPYQLTSEHAEGTQIYELCEKIQRLSTKRKHFKNNEEILEQRLKQSRLTYAELLRKQSKLMRSLEELKSCLNADEKLLSDEKRIADQIPDEIERLSVQLANLCSSQRIKVEDII